MRRWLVCKMPFNHMPRVSQSVTQQITREAAKTSGQAI